MAKGGWIYILTNKPQGSLHIGVMANLAQRLLAHREGRGSEHVKRYNLNKLVLAEPYPTIEEAIVREKQLKNWQRAWKLRLIVDSNPTWADLFTTMIDTPAA